TTSGGAATANGRGPRPIAVAAPRDVVLAERQAPPARDGASDRAVRDALPARRPHVLLGVPRRSPGAVKAAHDSLPALAAASRRDAATARRPRLRGRRRCRRRGLHAG